MVSSRQIPLTPSAPRAGTLRRSSPTGLCAQAGTHRRSDLSVSPQARHPSSNGRHLVSCSASAHTRSSRPVRTPQAPCTRRALSLSHGSLSRDGCGIRGNTISRWERIPDDNLARNLAHNLKVRAHPRVHLTHLLISAPCGPLAAQRSQRQFARGLRVWVRFADACCALAGEVERAAQHDRPARALWRRHTSPTRRLDGSLRLRRHALEPNG